MFTVCLFYVHSMYVHSMFTVCSHQHHHHQPSYCHGNTNHLPCSTLLHVPPCKTLQAGGSQLHCPTNALLSEMSLEPLSCPQVWCIWAISPVSMQRQACGSPCHSPYQAHPSVPMETLTVDTHFRRPAKQVPVGTADVCRGEEESKRI